MEHAATAWAVSLQNSDLGTLMRSSPFLYPAANLMHVLGLGFLLGPVILLDLRVLGLGRAVPLAPTARILAVVSGGSLAALLISGSALFAADAVSLAGNPLMQAKLALVSLGLINAALFRLEPLGWPQKGQAAASIAIWLLVTTCGRLTDYF